VALVTGAATGIGRATAAALARSGHPVAVCDIDAAGAEKLAATLADEGCVAVPIGCDVSDEDAVDAALATVRERLGTPSTVFVAAGIMRVAPFLDLSIEQWNRTLQVNLTGTLLVLQRCARLLVGEGRPGSMVAVASVAARGPRPDAADYAASKAAVLSLVRSAAVALAPHAIRVNALCPGVIDTEMTRRNAQRRAEREGITPEQALQRLVAHVPLGRAAAAEEVASVALRVLGDDFGYVTGQAINVCGGLEFD
jgi:NAD(P)-dependent dehydrogenase (short-subunit alcohol dehydrogenase family)